MSKKRIIRSIQLVVLTTVIAIGTMGAQCNWRGNRGEWVDFGDGEKHCLGKGNECDKGESAVIEIRQEW